LRFFITAYVIRRASIAISSVVFLEQQSDYFRLLCLLDIRSTYNRADIDINAAMLDINGCTKSPWEFSEMSTQPA